MDTETLLKDVQRFRQALDACHGDLDPTVFGRFPRGCCGTVSELLAAFLKDQGHGNWTYVCGIRRGDSDQNVTHAWLEQEGCIIDVTRDQFGKPEPEFLTADRSWYDEKFPEQASLDSLGEWQPLLCDAYARINKEIASGSGAV